MIKQLLKPQELAGLLGVHVSFIYDRTSQRSDDPIPHLKLGKYVRFELEQVEKWLAEHNHV
jgi:excisionase family DNA binding protein